MLPRCTSRARRSGPPGSRSSACRLPSRHRRRHRHRPGRRRHRPAGRVGRRERPAADRSSWQPNRAASRRWPPANACWRASDRPAPAATKAAPSGAWPSTPGRVLGVYRQGRIIPTDRRAKAEWVVPPGEDGGAEAGRDRARRTAASPSAGPEAGPHHRAARRHGRRPLRQPDRHPHPRHPAGISRRRARRSRDARSATPLGRRTDLRDIPLVTIDGEDARDFDDAVFAEPDGVGLPPHRRHRRCRALRPPRIAARPRGAHARQQRLFPRPRRADAARGTVQRLVQPAAGRGSRLPVRRTPHRRATAARPRIASAAA